MADDEEEEKKPQKKPKRACDGLRQELVNCLLESDCMKKLKLPPKDCLKPESPGYTSECKAINYAFFECKRSLLDARQRFRGRKGY